MVIIFTSKTMEPSSQEIKNNNIIRSEYTKACNNDYALQKMLMNKGDFGLIIKHGNKELINKSYDKEKHTWEWAAKNMDLEVIEWFRDNIEEEHCEKIWEEAAEDGNLKLIKWLHEHDIKGFTSDTMDAATEYGHLGVVKWLHENRNEGCTKWAIHTAAETGDIEMVKLLHHNVIIEKTPPDYAMDYAAMGGHLNVVKWLHKNRTEGYTEYGGLTSVCTTLAIINAIEGKHLEVVKWLYTNRHECSLDSLENQLKFEKAFVDNDGTVDTITHFITFLQRTSNNIYTMTQEDLDYISSFLNTADDDE